MNMEIIVDNFAGGGGASTGIELALGRSVDIAINHDPAAIAMHKANHPDTEHYLESVWDVEPREVVKGREVGLCWLSPDCTHFSKAKGGKPLKKDIRGLAWVAVRWAATVRPRVIILENVEEFKTWGPLTKDGLPCPDRKGKTFKSFVNALKRQGYQVDFRELRACDYGAPTSRKRFFMIARCDGRPIVWPKHTHGDPNSQEVKSGKLKPWRTAAEIIDWSKPCPSIFDTSEEIKARYGLRAVRPLAEKTMKRISLGIQKFVIENPDPFIISRDNKFLAPFLTQYHSYSSDGARGQTIDRPLLTQDTSNRYALVTSHLIKMKGTNIGQPVDQPLQTITAGGNHFGEVRAFLTHYYGTSVGSKLDVPLSTVVSKDRFGLVIVRGLNYQIADIGMRMLEPRELFDAQGFPTDYIIDKDHKGNRYPKTSQVARCGNSVPPQLAEHLVRANLPELCIGIDIGLLKKVSS
jgi:DNA (cytosine-5)-methyltransferase 1